MEALHLPDNIKVHFAGSEVQNQYIAAKELGVQYALYTAYPFVERMVFKKGTAPIMGQRWMPKGKEGMFIPKVCCEDMRHVIQDSGLFTLMFGSQKGKTNEAMIHRWYDALVEYTLSHGQPVTCVEVDCQKVLGVQKAWEFRERMRHDLPNNRIINVFHFEDGRHGLDRLIEFSDYIAISVPELRFMGKSNQVGNIARYIKHKKPSIDIHLLGCTDLEMLKQNRFCTSSDSTTWVTGKRYGFIKGKYHISGIKTDKVKELVGDKVYGKVMEYNKEQNTNFLLLQVMMLKRDYERAAGNQDYKPYL